MRTSPQRNIILRAMQPKQDPRTPADIVHTTDLRPGDYFFVCTDGMLERIYDRELFSLLADESLTDQQKAQRLCQLTERSVKLLAFCKDKLTKTDEQLVKLLDSLDN
jgi:protein phosphatase